MATPSESTGTVTPAPALNNSIAARPTAPTPTPGIGGSASSPAPTAPTTPLNVSGGAPSPGGGSPLSLGSYYASNPGVQGYGATTGTAGAVGTAPQGTAANTGPIAGINNGQINPNDATNAASQLDAITNANSPYIQQATQQGYLSAAARGLGNSSAASGASEAAAVTAAAPLAEQNASGATQGTLQNSQLQTQASEFNASQQNANQQLQAQLSTQQGQFNASQIQAAAAGNAQAQNAINAQTEQLQAQINQQGLAGVDANALANINGKWNSLIGSNSAAAQMFGNMLNGISSIMNNPNIAPDKASAMITAESNTLDGAFAAMNSIEGGTQPGYVNITQVPQGPAATQPYTNPNIGQR